MEPLAQGRSLKDELVAFRAYLIAAIRGQFDTSKPPCTHSPWPNVVCAASNWIFTGILALYVVWNDPWRRALTLLALISSTVYHLAEVKSRLPGLPILRKYASPLIHLDQFFAIVLMIDTARQMFRTNNYYVLGIGFAGTMCALQSERQIGWWFVLWHGLWHNAAFLGVALYPSPLEGILHASLGMNASTATRYLITLTAADWCDPAAGIYNGCNPADRDGYKISNIIFATINLAASLLLLIACLIRLRMVETRPVVFFVTSSMIMLGNIFIAMWCVLREVASSPPWATAAMFTGAGLCTISGIDYLLLIYRETQTVKNMLIYEGLKVYRRRWILYCITGFFCFSLYSVSYAIGPYLYNVVNRAFWLWFSVMMVYSVGGGVHHALKIRKHSTQVNRMAIWMIIILVPGILCTSLATASPVLINKTFWLWIAFYAVMQSAMVGVACLLAMWAFTVTRQRIKERSSLSSSTTPHGSSIDVTSDANNASLSITETTVTT